MKDKISVIKTCESCGEEFIANSTKARYCSTKCNRLALKRKKLLEELKALEDEIESLKRERLSSSHSTKTEYISISDAAKLLSVTRQTIYNWLKSGTLKGRRMSNRKILISRKRIDEMFEEDVEYVAATKRKRNTVTELYTVKDVERLYCIKYRRLHDIVKKENVPTTLRGNVLYLSKKHIDDYFKSRDLDVSRIKDWYSVHEIIDLYGITRDAIYGRIRDNNIPKKKDGRKVLISKKHFDEIYKVEL